MRARHALLCCALVFLPGCARPDDCACALLAAGDAVRAVSSEASLACSSPSEALGGASSGPRDQGHARLALAACADGERGAADRYATARATWQACQASVESVRDRATALAEEPTWLARGRRVGETGHVVVSPALEVLRSDAHALLVHPTCARAWREDQARGERSAAAALADLEATMANEVHRTYARIEARTREAARRRAILEATSR